MDASYRMGPPAGLRLGLRGPKGTHGAPGAQPTAKGGVALMAQAAHPPQARGPHGPSTQPPCSLGWHTTVVAEAVHTGLEDTVLQNRLWAGVQSQSMI